MEKENKIIITVSGSDKVGIVAKVATLLAECNVNIEDIKQTLMQGHFVMFMLCNISTANKSLKEFQTLLKDECSKMGMEAWVQRKEIFDSMHNVG
ncbi:MAG: ACT domain-containing protein [Candidatus Gastranaerophilales bacterium]|nr:ACT domain-containing protein [Candidatus Gastranaerophilales bacterium]